ncbi:MAG: SMP-30/gluconolactonase/LRE family protein [Candidatus Binataceae bacterium]
MEFEMLATGWGLIEGPRVDGQNRLYFSDNLFGGVFRRNPDGSIDTLLPDRKSVGGIAFNEDGRLIVSGPSISLWDERTGRTRNLAGEYAGKQLGVFNDLTIDDYGSVWSGDVGRKGADPGESSPGDLFRIDPDGTVTQMDEGIMGSNGLGFSPDRKLLYYSDSGAKVVYVYDVTAARTLKNRRVFARVGVGIPDGLALDAEGNIWLAVVYTSNLVCFKPDGTILKKATLPVKKVVSLTFGGPDLMDLYAVTVQTSRDKGSLYRARAEVPGLPIPKGKFKQ